MSVTSSAILSTSMSTIPITTYHLQKYHQLGTHSEGKSCLPILIGNDILVNKSQVRQNQSRSRRSDDVIDYVVFGGFVKQVGFKFVPDSG